MRTLPGIAIVIVATLLSRSTGTAQPAPVDTLTPAMFAEDFDRLWELIDENYAYADRLGSRWSRVRSLYRTEAERITSRRAFVTFLERVLDELHDPHAHLGTNTASSPRLIPTGSDLWAEWNDGRALVTQVRGGSGAERAGIRPGMEVVTIGEETIRSAVDRRLPRTLTHHDPDADRWALLAAIAGYRDLPVRLGVRSGRGLDTIEYTPGPVVTREGLLNVRKLRGEIGYIRIHNSLGEPELIRAYDSALAMLRDTRGLVLDLRETPSGGNTTVARGIIGRLIDTERPYQRHEIPAEERVHGVRRSWIEHVHPRGPFTYRAPVVVLVGRWTGSMGEGLAIGLDAARGATVAGERMAGLLGAIYSFTLPHSGFSVRFPAERLYHVDGRAREAFIPSVLLDPSIAEGEMGIEAAADLLRKR